MKTIMNGFLCTQLDHKKVILPTFWLDPLILLKVRWSRQEGLCNCKDLLEVKVLTASYLALVGAHARSYAPCARAGVALLKLAPFFNHLNVVIYQSDSSYLLSQLKRVSSGSMLQLARCKSFRFGPYASSTGSLARALPFQSIPYGRPHCASYTIFDCLLIG